MIRSFKNIDIDKVIEIWLSASEIAHNFVPMSFWKEKEADMRQIYIPKSETWVFEKNSEVVGFMSLAGNTLAAIFVSPQCQGMGIGKKLLNKAKEIGKELNLTVYSENKQAVDFYLKNEFKTLRKQVDQHTGHPELVMHFESLT